jgi:hypothetical protein
MSGCSAVVDTCVPALTAASSNPIGFPTSATCGAALCLNA